MLKSVSKRRVSLRSTAPIYFPVVAMFIIIIIIIIISGSTALVGPALH
jgi:hypothetical protein